MREVRQWASEQPLLPRVRLSANASSSARRLARRAVPRRVHPLVGPGRAGHNSEITLSSSKQHEVSLETWRLLRVTEEKVWFAKETKDDCWKKKEIKTYL